MSISSTVKTVMPYLKTASGYVLHRLSSQGVEMNDGTTLEQKVTSLNNLISQKVDSSDVVNNCLTTESGFVLDARQGKELDDKITELNGNLPEEGENYIKFANGTLIQWGVANSGSSDGGAVSINFAVPFIDALYRITTTPEYASSSYPVFLTSAQRVNTERAVIYFRQAYTAAVITGVNANWVAIGRWK